MRNVKKELWRFAVVVVIGIMSVFALEQYSYAEDFAVTNTKEFRKALENAANNGKDDTISLAPGTYKPSDDNAEAFEFMDTESKILTIKAQDGYGAQDVILDGEKKLRTLELQNYSSIEIQGISIINGKVDDNSGGGIYTQRQLTLKQCIIKGNSGGGINIGSGGSPLTITDCIITANSGIGINAGGWDLYISGSTISKNTGGGIDCSSVLMKNSYVYENTAQQRGAGIALRRLSVIVNSIISKNAITGTTMFEGSGSGIYNSSTDPLSVINCIISGNESNGRSPSAIYGMGMFVNNIFINNDIDIKSPNFSGNLAIYNNYIDYAKITDSGYGTITKKNNVEPSDGTPLFIDENLRPESGSVIIDKGLDPTSIDFNKLYYTVYYNAATLEIITNALEFDKDGKPRIVGDTIDLGAYEFDPDAPPPVIVDPPVVIPPVERVSMDETLSMIIPNIKCDGQLLNIGLNLEFYNNTSGLLIWKLKSSNTSNIQPLSSINISTDYKISFPEFIYQNQTIPYPVILEPYFNKADPFTLYWKLAM